MMLIVVLVMLLIILVVLVIIIALTMRRRVVKVAAVDSEIAEVEEPGVDQSDASNWEVMEELPDYSMIIMKVSDINCERPTGVRSAAFPRIMHICWKNDMIATSMFNRVIFPNNVMSPGCDHRFYTNSSIRAFLLKHFPPDVHEAFTMINPMYGACVSDFFRYCVLYVCGGIYMDIKAFISYDLTDMFDKLDVIQMRHKLVVSYWPMSRIRGIQSMELNHADGEIMNWVMCCTPGHPVMRTVIDIMCRNIRQWNMSRTVYGEKINVLRLTGPLFLTRTLLSLMDTEPGIYIDDSMINRHFRYSYYTNSVFIRNDQTLYKEGGITHYSWLMDPIILWSASSTTVPNIFLVENKTPDSYQNTNMTIRLIDTTVLSRIGVLLDIEPDVSRLSPSSMTDIAIMISLYDHGGYFIAPGVSLLQGWDDNIRHVDGVLCWNDDGGILRYMMKCPPQSPIMKACLLHILQTPVAGKDVMATLSAFIRRTVQTGKKSDYIGMSRVLRMDGGEQWAFLEMTDGTDRFIGRLDSKLMTTPVIHFAGNPIASVRSVGLSTY